MQRRSPNPSPPTQGDATSPAGAVATFQRVGLLPGPAPRIPTPSPRSPPWTPPPPGTHQGSKEHHSSWPGASGHPALLRGSPGHRQWSPSQEASVGGMRAQPDPASPTSGATRPPFFSRSRLQNTPLVPAAVRRGEGSKCQEVGALPPNSNSPLKEPELKPEPPAPRGGCSLAGPRSHRNPSGQTIQRANKKPFLPPRQG